MMSVVMLNVAMLSVIETKEYTLEQIIWIPICFRKKKFMVMAIEFLNTLAQTVCQWLQMQTGLI
jgi:hypothetical protein